MINLHGPELGSTDRRPDLPRRTQNLVSGSDHGGVETMSDDEEVEAEPRNTARLNITNFPLGETILPTVHRMLY